MMSITDAVAYFGPLHDDVERCLLGIQTCEDIEFWKRSYLRSLCTFVEARVFLIKMELKADNHLIDSQNLSQETLAFLNGTEWRIGNNGEIKSKTKIISPVEELKAVIKIIGAYYPNLLWDFRSSRWNRVKDLFDSRNKLVHPKSPIDLSVSDKDIQEFETFREDFIEWSASIYAEAWGKVKNGS